MPLNIICTKANSVGRAETGGMSHRIWGCTVDLNQMLSVMGSCMVWEINMGVCPRLEFDNIMFINCLGYDFYIYGAFEFLCNSIANL